MNLIEILNDNMKKAMKSHNKRELSVIRMVKASIQLEKINKQKELTDDEVLDIIIKQIKLRQDAIIEFKKANRNDLIDEYEKEIEILNCYLPQQLSDKEVEDMIDLIIGANNFTNSNDLGKIIKEIIPKVKGKYDLSKVNNIIKLKLN